MKNFASTALISIGFLCAAWAQSSSSNIILHGEVTQEGEPIAGALVSIYLLTPSGYAKNIVSTTNDKGGYFFGPLQKGNYAMLVNKGDTRLYQGMITITDKLDNEKNIDLSNDAFSGRWRLNLAKSSIPPKLNITEEIRSYSRKGDVMRYLVERTYRNKSKGRYQATLTCNGVPAKVAGQMISCQYKSPTIVETEQSPPRQFSRDEVNGDVLTITIFKDSSRLKPDTKYVYDRMD